MTKCVSICALFHILPLSCRNWCLKFSIIVVNGILKALANLAPEHELIYIKKKKSALNVNVDLPIACRKWYQRWLCGWLQWNLVNRIDDVINGKFVVHFISGDWKRVDIFLVQTICKMIQMWFNRLNREITSNWQSINAMQSTYRIAFPHSCNMWQTYLCSRQQLAR